MVHRPKRVLVGSRRIFLATMPHGSLATPTFTSRRVTYTARGFLPGKAVYAHFRFGGRTRRDVKIGIARGACGIVSKKMRLLPAKTRFGRWAIYMDQAPTYSKSTLLQARGSLVIQRTLR